MATVATVLTRKTEGLILLVEHPVLPPGPAIEECRVTLLRR